MSNHLIKGTSAPTREFKLKKNNVRNQIYSTISKVTGTLVSSTDILVTYHAIFQVEKSCDESQDVCAGTTGTLKTETSESFASDTNALFANNFD